jgi:hypothetical protein
MLERAKPEAIIQEKSKRSLGAGEHFYKRLVTHI